MTRKLDEDRLVDALTKVALEAIHPNPCWVEGFISLVKDVRAQENLGLRETLDFISKAFGFEPGDKSWYELRTWLHKHQVNLDHIRGPHAVTLMKAARAKYANVSTQDK